MKDGENRVPIARLGGIIFRLTELQDMIDVCIGQGKDASCVVDNESFPEKMAVLESLVSKVDDNHWSRIDSWDPSQSMDSISVFR